MANTKFSDDPINRFCELLESLPEADRRDLISYSHMAIGPVTAGHIFCPQLKDLRFQLERAVEFGMSEPFLIPGLLRYLIEHYRRWADPDVMTESIAFNEDKLVELRADLLKPRDERPTGIPDDQLQDLIEKMEQSLTGKNQQRIDANRLVGILEYQRDELFDQEYWRAWRQRKLPC